MASTKENLRVTSLMFPVLMQLFGHKPVFLSPLTGLSAVVINVLQQILADVYPFIRLILVRAC